MQTDVVYLFKEQTLECKSLNVLKLVNWFIFNTYDFSGHWYTQKSLFSVYQFMDKYVPFLLNLKQEPFSNRLHLQTPFSSAPFPRHLLFSWTQEVDPSRVLWVDVTRSVFALWSLRCQHCAWPLVATFCQTLSWKKQEREASACNSIGSRHHTKTHIVIMH